MSEPNAPDYAQQTWVDNNPSYPLSAARMKHIEAGLSEEEAFAKAIEEYCSTPSKPLFYDALAPAATGEPATDTVNLEAALAATPAAGSLLISGHYKINKTLKRSEAISLLGRSLGYTVGSEHSTPTSGPSEIAQLNGTIIEQTVAGIDNFDFTGSAVSFKCENVAFVFSSGLASTGEPLNLTPPVSEEGGHLPGVYGGFLKNVVVGGHDGNHYALRRTNVCEFTTIDFRSFGGGGILDVADSPKYNTGNIVDTHPYVHLFSEGSAHGIAREAKKSYPESNGSLNLITAIRPQVNIDGKAGEKGTQALWKDNLGEGEPIRCLVLAPDLEAPGHNNPVVFGEGTTVIAGDTLLGTGSQQLENVALGFRAAGKSSVNSAKQVTAFGWEAGYLNTVNATTALGALAARNATTAGPTAVGYKAAYKLTTGTHVTAVGVKALESLEANSGATGVGFEALSKATAASNTGFGNEAGNGVTSGAENCLLGAKVAKTLKTGSQNVLAGDEANVTAEGTAKASSLGYATVVGELAMALGYKAKAEAKGAVAIGVDATGSAAATATENEIALGTANHVVKISNGTTGSGSALLGANCPATTASAPSTWLRMHNSAGEPIYVPAWK